MRCHKCKVNYPLFMFHNNNMKYKIPAWKGKTFSCRVCIYRESRYRVVRFINGKFQILKLTPFQRFKEFFKP